jgi:hypothetical protein
MSNRRLLRRPLRKKQSSRLMLRLLLRLRTQLPPRRLRRPQLPMLRRLRPSISHQSSTQLPLHQLPLLPQLSSCKLPMPTSTTSSQTSTEDFGNLETG